MKHKTFYKHVRAVIRRYPHYCARLLEMQSASGDGVPARSPGRVSRPTERLALLELPEEDQRKEYDAVRRAIQITERMDTGAARLKVIAVKYWNAQRGDLYTAARLIHYSPQQTWRFHTDFEQLVARFLYGDCDA